uniref:Titin-like n=1 Tax=Ditylenchus dipsaci TaxID=166011 RepID=A0A915ETF3_9BILA
MNQEKFLQSSEEEAECGDQENVVVVESTQVGLAEISGGGWDSPMHRESELEHIIGQEVMHGEVDQQKVSPFGEQEILVESHIYHEESEKKTEAQERKASPTRTAGSLDGQEESYLSGRYESEPLKQQQVVEGVESGFKKPESEKLESRKSPYSPQTPESRHEQQHLAEQTCSEDETPELEDKELVESSHQESEQIVQSHQKSYTVEQLKSSSRPQSPGNLDTEVYKQQSFPPEPASHHEENEKHQTQEKSRFPVQTPESVDTEHHKLMLDLSYPGHQEGELVDSHLHTQEPQEELEVHANSPSSVQIPESLDIQEHHQQTLDKKHSPYPIEQDSYHHMEDELVESSPLNSTSPTEQKVDTTFDQEEETQLHGKSPSPPRTPTSNYTQEHHLDQREPSDQMKQSQEEENYQKSPPPTPRSSYSVEHQEAEKVVEQIFAPYQQQWDQENQDLAEDKLQSEGTHMISDSKDLVSSQEVRLGEQEELAGAVLSGAHTLPTHLDHKTEESELVVEVVETPMVSLYVAPLTDGHSEVMMIESVVPEKVPEIALKEPDNLAGETDHPASRPGSPVAESESPVRKAESSLEEPESPVSISGSPTKKSGSPVEVIESPSARQESPAGEHESPVINPESALREPESPATKYETQPGEYAYPVGETESPSPFVEMMGQEPQPQQEDQIIEQQEAVGPELRLISPKRMPQPDLGDGGSPQSRPSTPLKDEGRKTRSLYEQSHYSDERLDRPEYSQVCEDHEDEEEGNLESQMTDQVKYSAAQLESPLESVVSTDNKGLASELDSPVAISESPVGEPVSSVKRPESPVEEPKSPARVPESVLEKPEIPAEEPVSPVIEAESPVEVIQSLANQPESPAKISEFPIGEPVSPVRKQQSHTENPESLFEECKNQDIKPGSPVGEPDRPVDLALHLTQSYQQKDEYSTTTSPKAVVEVARSHEFTPVVEVASPSPFVEMMGQEPQPLDLVQKQEVAILQEAEKEPESPSPFVEMMGELQEQDSHSRQQDIQTSEHNRELEKTQEQKPVSESLEYETHTQHKRESSPNRLEEKSESIIGVLESPVGVTESPAGESKSPAGDLESPVRKDESPVREPESPDGKPKNQAEIIESPVGEPNSPAGVPESHLQEKVPQVVEKSTPHHDPQGISLTESPSQAQIQKEEDQELVHSTSYHQDLGQEHLDLHVTETYISTQVEEDQRPDQMTQEQRSAPPISPLEGEFHDQYSPSPSQGESKVVVSGGTSTPQVVISAEWVVDEPEEEEPEHYTFSPVPPKPFPEAPFPVERIDIEDWEEDVSIQESQKTNGPHPEEAQEGQEEYVVDSSEVDYENRPKEMEIEPDHQHLSETMYGLQKTEDKPKPSESAEDQPKSPKSVKAESPNSLVDHLEEPEPLTQEDILLIPNASLPPDHEQVDSPKPTDESSARFPEDMVESEEVMQEPEFKSPSPPISSHLEYREEEREFLETESPALSPLPTQDLEDKDNIFDVGSPSPPLVESEKSSTKVQLSPQHQQVTLQDVYGTNMPPLPSPLLQSHSAAPTWNKDQYNDQEEDEEDYELVENQDIVVQSEPCTDMRIRHEEGVLESVARDQEEDYYMVGDQDMVSDHQNLPPDHQNMALEPTRQPSEEILQYKAAELVHEILENIQVPTEASPTYQPENQEDEDEEEMIQMTTQKPASIAINPPNQLGLPVSEELFRPKSPVPPAYAQRQALQQLDSPEEERKGSSDSINIENSSGSSSSVNSLRKHKQMASAAADNISEGSLQEFERIEQELGVHRRVAVVQQ